MVDPLGVSLIVLLCVSGFTWVASLATGNSSWVDRSWSITPILYVGVFAGSAGFRHTTLTVMFVLVTLWGARLTFNFWRKGGYQRGGEDYRWPILRERMSGWQYQVFNLVFIVVFQNVLLWLISLPALVVLEAPETAFGPAQLSLTVAFLALLALETAADQQQWNFHQRKARMIEQGQHPSPRFLDEGLFKYSRHPNFFAEQAQWWVFWGFGAVALGTLAHWSVIAPLLLSALFWGSTRFTEAITREKYPEYANYQARTSAIVPWIPRRESRTSGLTA